MNYQIITYTDKDFSLDVRVTLEDKMMWLNQYDLAKLFNKSQSSISKHINSFFKNGVLIKDRVYSKIEYTGGDGKTYNVDFYNTKVLAKLQEKFNSKRCTLLLDFVQDYFTSVNGIAVLNHDIIICDNGKVNISLEFSQQNKTIWASQNQIAALFETTQSNVSRHIKNILTDEELDSKSIYEFFAYMGENCRSYSTAFYSLDMILAVGYRVSTKKAIAFRNWASSVLKEYMYNSYSINKEKCFECQSNIIQLQKDYLELRNSINKQINFRPGEKELVYNAIVDFLKKAEKEIIIIDNYFGNDFDDVLSQINVEKTIVTNPKNSKIETNSIYKVVKRNDIHDRYIIVDDVCYHFGASIIDVGSNISSSSKIESKYFINHLKTIAKQ